MGWPEAGRRGRPDGVHSKLLRQLGEVGVAHEGVWVIVSFMAPSLSSQGRSVPTVRLPGRGQDKPEFRPTCPSPAVEDAQISSGSCVVTSVPLVLGLRRSCRAIRLADQDSSMHMPM